MPRVEYVKPGGVDSYTGSAPVTCKTALSRTGTITALDDDIAKAFEPGASPPSERLEAAKDLVQESIPVWVFVAPVLPGVGASRESLEDLLSAIRDAGISTVSFDRLNPYPRSVALLRATYRRQFPGALPYLEEYLRHPIAYWADFEMLARSLAEGIGLETNV